jgi:hypothetical protein
LIYDEPRGADPRVTVITRGGTATGENRETQGRTENDHGVRKAIEKTPTFDAKKERHIFEEERKEFKGDQEYSSKRQPKIKEYGMPQAFDLSASPTEGKEVSKLLACLQAGVLVIDGKIRVCSNGKIGTT